MKVKRPKSYAFNRVTDNELVLRSARYKEEVFIPLSTICFFEADQNYVRLHNHENQQLHFLCSLVKLQQSLANSSFCRIHKKYLINLQHTRSVRLKLRNESVEENEGSGGYVKIRFQNSKSDDQQAIHILKLPIGREYRQIVSRFVKKN